MRVTSLGWQTDLMLRRLAGSTIEDHGSHLVVRTPANPGFWWGNFLLLAAPPGQDDASGWLTTFSDAFPYAEHLAFGVDGVDAEVGSGAEAMGLEVELSTVLTTTCFPPRQAGPPLGIRPLETDEDWRQPVVLELVCHDQPDSPSHALFVARRVAEERALVEAGHGVWFGAFPDGRLRASLGLITDGSGVARYQNVETQPEFRRRGLATQLVHEAGVEGLSHLGAKTLVIVADPDDVAVRIYRSLGFVDTERQVQLFGGPQASE
jgi:ribosomal protein S18 acetylase RimI-like enzyme